MIFVSFLEVKSVIPLLDYGTQIGSKVGMQKSKSTTKVIICQFDSGVASESQIEGLQIWEFLL